MTAIVQDTRADTHLISVPGTSWRMWRDLAIRSAGFPIDGLARFTAPRAAQAADDFLAGRAPEAEFDVEFEAATLSGLADAREIARDPLFREAVAWQGRNVWFAVDGIARAEDTARRSSKLRQREIAVLRYWQRYCTKNESIGFFGPVTWVRADADAPVLAVRPGPGLVRARRVRLEYWAIKALADKFAENPLVRRWFPVSTHPHHAVRGRELLRPTQPPVALSAAEAAVLARCDGRKPAWKVAECVAADGVVRRPEDVLAMFEVFVSRDLLRWDADLPDTFAAESLLRQRLDAVPDDEPRRRCLADFGRLTDARDQVADAAGDPERLRAALRAIDTVFTELTGEPAQRCPGEMYAGRTVCVEDTVRDVDVDLSPELFAPIAESLEVLLRAARWVTAEVARVYLGALRELYHDLAGEFGAEVPLGRLWFLAQGLLFGDADKPSDAISAEFTRRWSELFGLTGASGAVTVRAADIAERVAEVFPAGRPGWRHARLHAPDLVICAADVAHVRRGDYFAVLGELHTASATLDLPLMVQFHRNPADLVEALAADTRPGRIEPLYPLHWPRNGARVGRCLQDAGDLQLGLDVAPGADRDRLWPMAAVTVREQAGGLVAVGPDGTAMPLVEVFSEVFWVYAVDAFKLVAPAAHTPRISIDRLVVARETWRTTVGETGLAGVTDERAAYLAARRWRAGLGLPDRVFVKVSTEVKPFYVDLTSPQHVSSFRRVLASAGDDAAVVITELLPGPEHAWLTDGQGRRYTSELRMHLRDPEPANSEGSARDGR